MWRVSDDRANYHRGDKLQIGHHVWLALQKNGGWSCHVGGEMMAHRDGFSQDLTENQIRTFLFFYFPPLQYGRILCAMLYVVLKI